jgi:cobalt-zinc-cadmium efflux system outer membrane protein
MALRLPQPALRIEVDQPPDTPTYRMGIELPLPLWNRREGPVAEAAAQLRQTRALAQSREIEILAAMEGAYGRYQTASQQLAAFEHGLLPRRRYGLPRPLINWASGVSPKCWWRSVIALSVSIFLMQFDRQAALIDLNELRAVELKENAMSHPYLRRCFHNRGG